MFPLRESQTLARGLEEKMDSSRTTFKKQEAGEKETKQQEKKLLSRSSPALFTQEFSLPKSIAHFKTPMGANCQQRGKSERS